MFNWGVIGAFIGIFFSGLSVTLSKRQAMNYTDKYLAVLYKCSFIVIRAIIMIALNSSSTGEAIIPSMSVANRVLLISLSILGYSGLISLYKAYDKLHGGVVGIICSISVFLMYFMNAALFPGVETLSLPKIAVAIVFFLIIIQFIVHHTTDKLHHTHFINTNTLFALRSALCGALFNTGSNYLIKTGAIDGMHIVFISECIVFLCALAWYFTFRKGTFHTFKTSLTRRDGLIFGTLAMGNVIAGSLYLYAYESNPANLINFIKLFSIIVAMIFCRIFLKDTLSKKQAGLIICAVSVLIIFLIV